MTEPAKTPIMDKNNKPVLDSCGSPLHIGDYVVFVTSVKTGRLKTGTIVKASPTSMTYVGIGCTVQDDSGRKYIHTYPERIYKLDRDETM